MGVVEMHIHACMFSIHSLHVMFIAESSIKRMYTRALQSLNTKAQELTRRDDKSSTVSLLLADMADDTSTSNHSWQVHNFRCLRTVMLTGQFQTINVRIYNYGS